MYIGYISYKNIFCVDSNNMRNEDYVLFRNEPDVANLRI